MVVDKDSISLATRFDSGINLLTILQLSGGMPTRVSVPRKRLAATCTALGMNIDDVEQRLVRVDD